MELFLDLKHQGSYRGDFRGELRGGVDRPVEV